MLNVSKIQNGSEKPFDFIRRLMAHKNDVLVCNNTRAILCDDGSVVITLHSHTILTAWSDGMTIIKDGGYQSNTTKDRLNRFLPLSVRVFQKNWNWFIDVRSMGDSASFTNGMILRFNDVGKCYDFGHGPKFVNNKPTLKAKVSDPPIPIEFYQASNRIAMAFSLSSNAEPTDENLKPFHSAGGAIGWVPRWNDVVRPMVAAMRESGIRPS